MLTTPEMSPAPRAPARTAAIVGLGLAVAILAVIAVVTLTNLQNTSDRLDAATQRTEIGDAYSAINLAVTQAQLHSFYYLETSDPAERVLIMQSIGDILAADERVKAAGTDEDRAFVASLEERFGAQLADGMRILAGNDSAFSAPSSAGNISVLNDIAKALAEPVAASRLQTSSELRSTKDDYRNRARQVLAAIGFGIPMLGLLAFALYRYEEGAARERAELERLSKAALTDGLTGLANHRAFQEDLRREVMRASRRGRAMSVAMIDVDNFKEVNDSRGHAHGDTVLMQLAKLMTFLRGEDRAYRVGGDEFSLILPEEDEAGTLAALDRLRQAVADGIEDVTISIGVSSTESGVRNPVMLRDHADAALYAAKHRGKNQVATYEPGMDRPTEVTAAKMSAVREVLTSREVTMWFQPIFKLDTHHLLAFEALLRLPESLDLEGPEETFQIAQHLGRSLELDLLCAGKALDTGHDLPAGCLMFINLDPATLIHVGFTPDLLVRLVEEHGLTPGNVVFEITEKTDAPLDLLGRQIEALRQHGFGVALDDVGAGNSGLEMLRLMKFDYVKIDRSVILDAMGGGPGRAVILAIVAFAREAHAYLIAEGIENKAMLDTIEFDEDGLRKYWVQAVQGFLFGMPRKSVDGYISDDTETAKAA